MTPVAYVATIDISLRQLADAAAARSMRAYLLEQFEFLGICAPLRREAVRAVSEPRWSSPAEVIEVTGWLWEKPEREFRYTAIDLLKRHARLFDMSHVPAILNLLQRDAWWETVDGLTPVIGAILLEQVRSGNDVQHTCDDWIRHQNHWVRRCAMLHQRGWRLHTDIGRLFGYAEMLAAEKEFFIRKAIGWALRDYARWNPEGVRRFVEQRDALFSRLTVREASRNLAR